MATAKVRYVGHSPAVDVPLDDGTIVTVANGDIAEFPADVAKSLAAQEGEWEKVVDKSRKGEEG